MSARLCYKQRICCLVSLNRIQTETSTERFTVIGHGAVLFYIMWRPNGEASTFHPALCDAIATNGIRVLLDNYDHKLRYLTLATAHTGPTVLQLLNVMYLSMIQPHFIAVTSAITKVHM